jgi:hypothetical protein
MEDSTSNLLFIRCSSQSIELSLRDHSEKFEGKQNRKLMLLVAG